jgi:hypothetical protein
MNQWDDALDSPSRQSSGLQGSRCNTRHLPTRLVPTRPRRCLPALHISFIAGVGVQVGTFDPVFMQRMGSDGLAPGFPTRLGCVPRPSCGGG